MSFTPKFVDLVRNATSVQGTGAVVLGAAPAGFTGFGQACASGDRFYYCIQGVDKPAEREVGRGTLQADGTIAREAISGELTRFSAGAKTISLVAAADWFQQIAAMVSAPPPSAGGGSEVTSRSALAAFPAPASGTKRQVTESGCEGLFGFDAANRQAQVASDPRRGMFVAPTSDPTGASGAWVRVLSGAIRPEWWGATADSDGYGPATDNLAAFNAMFAFMGANPLFQWAGAKSAYRVELGHGTYYFSEKLLCRPAKTFVMVGKGGGWRSSAPATKLLFAAGKKGLIFDRGNTLDDVADEGDGRGNDGSHIRDLMVESLDNGAGTDIGAHGIQARCQLFRENVTVRGFRGHGIYIIANGTVADMPYRGSANSWMGQNCSSIENKGSGLRVQGQDSNQGMEIGGDFSGNGGWGISANCFLGSHFFACHTTGNVLGPYQDENGGSLFLACYSEGNQPPANLNGGLAIGGMQGAGVTNGQHLYADSGMLRTNGGFYGRKLDNGVTYNVAVRPSEVDFLSSSRDGGAAPFVCRFYGLGGPGNEDNVAFGHGYSGPTIVFHGPGSTLGPPGGATVAKLAVGNLGSSTTVLAGNPPPATAAKGAVCLNSYPGDGEEAFWRQVSGDPVNNPVWEPIYGAINKRGIGYSVYGAGGSVSQAASKSSGVALHKMAGLVTMHDAAIDAGTAVRFTVSNDKVRPQDTIQLSLAGGAADPTAYGWGSVAGKGSFDIVVRNFASAALGEALAFNFTVIRGQWL